MNKKINILIIILIVVYIISVTPSNVYAASDFSLSDLGIQFNQGNTDNPQATVDSLKLLTLFTILTLVPSFLILTTSFTRIAVVLSFLRNAIGTQQTPPNQLLIGLALFLTFFVMKPVYSEVLDIAINPYLDGQISQQEAFSVGSEPIKEFMLNQTSQKDLGLFIKLSKEEPKENLKEISFTTLIPAFVISELKTAFKIGFLLFIPFIVIDLIVASILMSMGMFMLPPVMISLPFKLLLFIMIDGWYLVVQSLVESFI